MAADNGERSGEETTKPFMRPAWTWRPSGMTTSQIIGTWPASTSRMQAISASAVMSFRTYAFAPAFSARVMSSSVS